MNVVHIGPAELDVVLPRGNDVELVFKLKRGGEPVDLGDDAFDLAIRWPGGGLTKSSGDGLALVAAEGRIRCPFSAAETRSLPSGRIARYELERRNGNGQRTYLAGHLIATGGLNDD